MRTLIKSLFLLTGLIANTAAAQQEKDSIPQRKIDQYSKESTDSLLGKPLIDFQAMFLTGENFRLSDHKGKVILLNFWFIGCPPCMGEIGDINELQSAYKDSNFVLVSLATNSVAELNKFNKGKLSRPIEPIEYPVVPDCRSISDKYMVHGFPTTILIDKQGIIRLIMHGASVESLKKYISFYGDKGLSKGWKELAEKYATVKEPDVSEVYSELINELLRE